MKSLDFGYLIDPVEPGVFIEQYWERRPLVIQRDQASHFSALLSLPEVAELIASGQLRYPEVKLVKNGVDVPPRTYVESQTGTIRSDLLRAQMKGGATVILGALQRHWAQLWRFCRNLEDFLSHPVQANVYLTPPGEQGFAPHFDTHDVFVLQIAGTKRWRIYEGPVRLPDDSLGYETRIEEPGEPLAAYDFRPGTLAYLPRGFVHEAVAADEAALHITLGVAAVTWADLFAAALAGLRVQDERFRASLPVGFCAGRAAGRAHRRRICAARCRAGAAGPVRGGAERAAGSAVPAAEPAAGGRSVDAGPLRDGAGAGAASFARVVGLG